MTDSLRDDHIGSNATNAFTALVRAAQRYGLSRPAIVDGDERVLTYSDVFKGIHALGSAIKRQTSRGEKVGLLLPTSAGGAVTFFALLAHGRVPAVLNFTAGRQALEAACTAGEIKLILTSRRFESIGQLEELIEELRSFAKVVYLEDMREALTLTDKLSALIGSRFPALLAKPAPASTPATLLFTSGTEGEPKGVALSHENVVSNIRQVKAALPFEREDIFFNPLPIFHSYGLVAGTLLPLLLGNKAVLHPSPLHVKQIPERIQANQATIMLATDTFVRQYTRAAEDGAMSSLRFVVCGAERVRPETREMAESRFGFEVVEGYGVTETSPVLACNDPTNNKAGTVGKPLPWIETRLEPVEGIDDGARLHVKGPNVMMGYIAVEAPGKINPPPGGWHDTGDVVTIDNEGYITIKGRLKRFAKIGGERVSLTISEAAAFALWPDFLHATTTVPDAQRGEAIVLVTEKPDANRADLLQAAQSTGAAEITVPRHILHVPEIPLLGTGKVNLVALGQLARDRLAG